MRLIFSLLIVFGVLHCLFEWGCSLGPGCLKTFTAYHPLYFGIAKLYYGTSPTNSSECNGFSILRTSYFQGITMLFMLKVKNIAKGTLNLIVFFLSTMSLG